MGSRFLPLFLAAFSAVSAFAAGPDEVETPAGRLERRAVEKKLWEHRQWLNLVHYEKGWFGGTASQADGDAFFLSSEGKVDPRAELVATIRAFFRPPTAAELEKPKALTDPEVQKILRETADAFANSPTPIPQAERERRF